jgi:predicted lipid carrier protein YhbT
MRRKDASMNLSHLVNERNGLGDTGQQTGRGEFSHEFAEIGVSHWTGSSFPYRSWICRSVFALAQTVSRSWLLGWKPNQCELSMLPPIVSTLAAPLPLPLVQRIAQTSLEHVLERHPELFDRLGTFAERPIAICPTDVPFEFTLVPAHRVVRATRRGTKPQGCATRISGPIVLLLALAEGRLDGDAEFFGRKITIEGDMETALALRNAAESISLDFVRDLLPQWPPGPGPARLLLGALRQSLLTREGLPCN